MFCALHLISPATYGIPSYDEQKSKNITSSTCRSRRCTTCHQKLSRLEHLVQSADIGSTSNHLLHNQNSSTRMNLWMTRECRPMERPYGGKMLYISCAYLIHLQFQRTARIWNFIFFCWSVQVRSFTDQELSDNDNIVTVTEALVLRPLLEDRRHIRKSIRILVPVDRMKQKCFQITTKRVRRSQQFLQKHKNQYQNKPTLIKKHAQTTQKNNRP